MTKTFQKKKKKKKKHLKVFFSLNYSYDDWHL